MLSDEAVQEHLQTQEVSWSNQNHSNERMNETLLRIEGLLEKILVRETITTIMRR